MHIKVISATIGGSAGILTYIIQTTSNISLPINLVVSIGSTLFFVGLSYGMLKRDILTLARDHNRLENTGKDIDERVTKVDDTLRRVEILLARQSQRDPDTRSRSDDV